MTKGTLTKEQFFDLMTEIYNFYKNYFDCNFELEPKLTTGIDPITFTFENIDYRLYLKLGKIIDDSIDSLNGKTKLHDEIIKENSKQVAKELTEQYEAWLKEWKELLAKALQEQKEKEEQKKKQVKKEFSFDDINFDNEHVTINIYYGI